MKKQNSSAEVLKRLLIYAKPHRKYLILALISALISVGFSLLIPVLIGNAVDFIIGVGQVYFLGILKILAYLGISMGISAIFQWFMTFCTNHITFYTVKDLRRVVFRKINAVPLKYIDNRPHGDIINSMINDIDQVSDGLLQGFSQLFTGIITILGTLIFMLTINPSITIVVVILTPLSLFAASFISKRIYVKFREQTAIRGELGGYIEEMIGNQKVVKAFSYEERAQETFEEINSRLYSCGVMAQFYSALTNPCTRFVNGLVYAVVGITGAFSAINGTVSIGQVSSFLAYANQYTKPFNEISGVLAELQSALASAARLFAFIDAEEESLDDDLLEEISVDGSLTISDVDFSYNPEKPLIEDLNLSIRPGEKVAIVGPTGSGKTTLINLLMGFYPVDSGSIKVSGVNIEKMKRKTLRNIYGMVLQDSWLFHGTILDNIRYGNEDATEVEVIEAAKAAHAHSFIARLPGGYDTVISEEGGNISQGQKQLLCIARIMLIKPPMLILDEATSNIDTLTEINIQKAFARLMEGRTSFIVAHRLSTIRESDCILVMKSGHIIEKGNHEELINKGGFYAELYNSQFDYQ
ncbi:MAG: ABC transporter ATP-binding protein [Clostridiales bacterium]|nr:ABC transporter ATP-binding protein [Clostridiales bacterium]